MRLERPFRYIGFLAILKMQQTIKIPAVLTVDMVRSLTGDNEHCT